MSLSTKLPLSFAGVALLTMIVLGAILVPLLGNHYSRSEESYLDAGAQRAAQDLAGVDWTAVAEELTASKGPNQSEENPPGVNEALRQVQAVALSTQLRVRVFAPDRELLVDSGPVADIDIAAVLAGNTSRTSGALGGLHSGRGEQTRLGQGKGKRGMPNPMGEGLFRSSGAAEAARSNRMTEIQLTETGQTVAILRLSEGPAYSATAWRNTLVAWLLAGVVAVLLAAVVGWLTSRRLSKPLLAMTAASDRMARGDLGVRTEIDRADEIGRLAGSFNTMAERTQHTVSALRTFAADAAHELSTPLTALETDLELAQTQEDEGERRRLIHRAMGQAERIDRLSRNLLLLSRLDAGTMPTNFGPVDLALLARQVADGAASRAEQAGLDLILELPSTELRVTGSEEGLRTALGNLVDNALKFTPAGGTVTVGAETRGPTAVVWVKDTGIGIPLDDMEALFSRFHRGRNASRYAGSGLGLAIVKATMDIHGGAVTVDSSPQGSRFELRLPLI